MALCGRKSGPRTSDDNCPPGKTNGQARRLSTRPSRTPSRRKLFQQEESALGPAARGWNKQHVRINALPHDFEDIGWPVGGVKVIKVFRNPVVAGNLNHVDLGILERGGIRGVGPNSMELKAGESVLANTDTADVVHHILPGPIASSTVFPEIKSQGQKISPRLPVPTLAFRKGVQALKPGSDQHRRFPKAIRRGALNCGT
jgi:hypothetical protein